MKRILNIAHRGFTKTFPDNTLEAFEAAIGIGVDGIECDVQETADHKFVIFHDTQLRGTDVRELTLAQIENVKLESRYEIPKLEETLDLCRKRVKLLVELKQLRSFDRFLPLLRSRAELDDVTIASLNQDLVSKLSYLAPEIRRGVITDLPVKDPIRIAELTHSDIIFVRLRFASAELVDNIHRNNLSIFVWDCAGLNDVRNALKLDIDGIISDSPDLVIRQLGMRA